jgi:hypothetical protein
MGHVAAPEPTSTGRQGPELRNAWRRRSSTQQEDEAQGHGPRGSTGAHLSKEVRSRATGHMAAPEPTSVGRYSLKLQLMWQHVDARPAPCLNLELVCGVADLQGADKSRLYLLQKVLAYPSPLDLGCKNQSRPTLCPTLHYGTIIVSKNHMVHVLYF